MKPLNSLIEHAFIMNLRGRQLQNFAVTTWLEQAPHIKIGERTPKLFFLGEGGAVIIFPNLFDIFPDFNSLISS